MVIRRWSALVAFVSLAFLACHSYCRAEIIAVPPNLEPGDQYRLAFVTSGTVPANSISIGFYNEFVQDRIDDLPPSNPLKSLGTSWKAIASTDSISARVNTATDSGPGLTYMPIYLVTDGTLVAWSYNDLWDGTLGHLIDKDERGEHVHADVWTGTWSNGNAGHGFYPLGGREDNFGNRGVNPLYGLTWSSGAGYWTMYSSSTQPLSKRLYGISDVITFEGEPEPGDDQDHPVMPTNGEPDPDGSWNFNDVGGEGRWFDPLLATGYHYETDGLSNFTQVQLPVGIPDDDNLYLVSDDVNGSISLAGGDSYAFPVAVGSFTVTGISPPLDGSDPLAFPTFLAFDQSTVSFQMTPIPEPSTLWLLAIAALCVLCRRRR